MKTDLDRVRKAMRNIYVSGGTEPELSGETRNEGPGGRAKMIEEAISAIMADGKTAMDEIYFGIKHYSGFGDQRSDSEYGMGPRHGSIVFSIGRTSVALKENTVLGADEVYLLEAVRDYGEVKDPQGDRYEVINLLDVLARVDKFKTQAMVYESMLATAEVESHAEVV